VGNRERARQRLATTAIVEMSETLDDECKKLEHSSLEHEQSLPCCPPDYERLHRTKKRWLNGEGNYCKRCKGWRIVQRMKTLSIPSDDPNDPSKIQNGARCSFHYTQPGREERRSWGQWILARAGKQRGFPLKQKLQKAGLAILHGALIAPAGISNKVP